jgi:hypothetical protein
VTRLRPDFIPPWIDVSAIIQFVHEEIERLKEEVVYLDNVHEHWSPGDGDGADLHAAYDLVMEEARRGWWKVDEITEEQHVAVEAALRGDLRPLLRLIKSFTFVPHALLGKRHVRLSPEAWQVIQQFLTRERSLKSGKPEGVRGPRRQSEEARRRRHPIHNAGDLAPIVTAILRRFYPAIRRAELKQRAHVVTVAIAKRIKRPKEPMTAEDLGRYLRRPRNDPHRAG